jgi:hypothetical protein
MCRDSLFQGILISPLLPKGAFFYELAAFISPLMLRAIQPTITKIFVDRLFVCGNQFLCVDQQRKS